MTETHKAREAYVAVNIYEHIDIYIYMCKQPFEGFACAAGCGMM